MVEYVFITLHLCEYNFVAHKKNLTRKLWGVLIWHEPVSDLTFLVMQDELIYISHFKACMPHKIILNETYKFKRKTPSLSFVTVGVYMIK